MLLVAVVLAQAAGEALAHERIVVTLGDGAAGVFDAREQSAATQRIVADHVLALAELLVEQVQRVGCSGGLSLPLLEAGDDFFDGVELLDCALETLREIGDGGAELVGLFDLRIEHAALLQRLAKAAQRVSEGFQLRHAILREVTQHAQQRPESGRDDRPALMQAERLIFQPAGGDEAIEKLPGALPGIAQSRALILGEQRQWMPRDDFLDDLSRLPLREPARLARFLDQPVRAVHIHRRRGPGQRAEEIRRDAAAESGAERFGEACVAAHHGETSRRGNPAISATRHGRSSPRV